ncbi:MAG TPA: VOC family protein [Cyclobacteriaceae bacterium]|jgi:lactoylglutathione lyase|nr:VOC family protein [Cyclobacteriaceae bacterium]
MKIEHLAIWVHDLEKMKSFYGKYFAAEAGPKYFNEKKNFESYFLHLKEGCRIELMRIPHVNEFSKKEMLGIAHIAIAVGSKESVDSLTQKLKSDGLKVIGEPRTTGDGYYESVILDPEGNRIEITI